MGLVFKLTHLCSRWPCVSGRLKVDMIDTDRSNHRVTLFDQRRSQFQDWRWYNGNHDFDFGNGKVYTLNPGIPKSMLWLKTFFQRWTTEKSLRMNTYKIYKTQPQLSQEVTYKIIQNWTQDWSNTSLLKISNDFANCQTKVNRMS